MTDLFATIKPTSKYWHQNDTNAQGEPVPFAVYIDHHNIKRGHDDYAAIGNQNAYCVRDLLFYVRGADGSYAPLHQPCEAEAQD